MRVHLGGHLSWYEAQKRSWLDLQVATPVSLLDLLARLGVPPAEVAMATVNGKASWLVGLGGFADTLAGDEDRVEFYPPIGGG